MPVHDLRPALLNERTSGQPLVVSYGAGVDSTALLVLLAWRGIRPDAILFADTGSERPETYAYLPIMGAWLHDHGFPAIQTVRYRSAFYATIEENCVANRTLPSLAFGRKSCSLKWKVSAMDAWVRAWAPAQHAWRAGLTVLRAIGYDASPADLRRSRRLGDARFTYVYPLRDAGIDRSGCARLIAGARLPVPPKSACFFCPATKRHEVLDLVLRHPALAARALRLEALAAHGLRRVRGLGRNWSWRSFLAQDHPELLVQLERDHDCGAGELARYAAGGSPWPDGVTPRVRLARLRAANRGAAA